LNLPKPPSVAFSHRLVTSYDTILSYCIFKEDVINKINKSATIIYW